MTRLAWALPFTVIADEAGVLRLIAGEDVRYTFRAAEIEIWAPPLLEPLAHGVDEEEALSQLCADERPRAAGLLRRLREERLVVEREPRRPTVERRWRVHGEGPLADLVRAAAPQIDAPKTDDGAPSLGVLVQRTLDHRAALDFMSAQRGPWIWVTEGPMARAFVGPVFLPDGGPCLGCLLAASRRLSPSPELYEALLSHADAGGEFTPVDFPTPARAILASILALKAEGLSQVDRPAFVFDLHVLTLSTLEVERHAVAVDVDCEHHAS